MVHAAVGEAAAHRQAGLAGANHDTIDVVHRTYPTLMPISTGTSLVMMSNTAERARDCSTIWRSFSSGASPLMVKVARIFS